MTPFQSDALNRLVSRKFDQDETILWSAERCRATFGEKALHWLRLVSFGLAASGVILLDVLLPSFSPMSHSLIGRIFGVFAVLVFCMGCATDVYGVLSANRHAYAVTNKRIFILNDFLMPLARPMPPEDIDFVALVQHDGRGTITLQHAPGLRFYKIGLCALKEQFLPQKIMNAPNAEGAIKPLNALLQIKKDREADAPKTLNVNQRLVEPMSRV